MSARGLLLFSFLCAACGSGVESSENDLSKKRTWPQGTVLAVNDRGLQSEDVDAILPTVALIQPQSTKPHQRRLVLTNFHLPLLATQSLYPEPRDEAFSKAEEALGELADNEDAHASILAEGAWRALGFELWCQLHALPLNKWHGPLELSGRFVLAKILERPAEPGRLGWKVRLIDFPYVPPGDVDQQTEQAIDQSQLTIVDPAWGEIIPEVWKHRMSQGRAR